MSNNLWRLISRLVALTCYCFCLKSEDNPLLKLCLLTMVHLEGNLVIKGNDGGLHWNTTKFSSIYANIPLLFTVFLRKPKSQSKPKSKPRPKSGSDSNQSNAKSTRSDPKSGSFLYDNYIAVNFCPRQRHSGGDPYLKLFEEEQEGSHGRQVGVLLLHALWISRYIWK